MPTATIQQMRALLAEKFPGLRTTLESPVANYFAPDAAQKNEREIFHKLPKGALAEIVAAQKNSGSAGLIHELIHRAASENQIVAFIDGNDSLDATQLDETVLARLFWVRCRSAATALKAADLILRDNNFSCVLLDLKLNPPSQLQKISATTWYRLQRLIEKSATVCAIFTPRKMVGAAQTRIILPPCSEISVPPPLNLSTN